jgi:predicted enzyme related to lactoylglutathione lyase
MAEMTGYSEGVPCWTDLGTPDVGRAKEFYSALFGWDYIDTGEEGGHYQLATLKGQTVAGIMEQQPDWPGPSMWMTYLWADDADGTAKKIRDAGGAVLMEPMDVMDQGRMAVASDPPGAMFGLWQGRAHKGAGLANEPGAFTWNDNLSTDPLAARKFYAAVLGYDYEVVPDPADPAREYAMIKVDGRPVGGIAGQPSYVPAGTPSYWNVYFSVADADEAVRTVERAGGSVVLPAAPAPYGRQAVVRDHAGALMVLVGAPTGDEG